MKYKLSKASQRKVDKVMQLCTKRGNSSYSALIGRLTADNKVVDCGSIKATFVRG